VTETTLGYAFLGGLLPSFIWLYFLLKEDARYSEPKQIILLAFVAGMVAIPLALPLERWSCAQFAIDASCTAHQFNMQTLLAWATIEEVLKYTMAALFILWRRTVDESPDYVIYMITIALGFASAENMLFLFDSLSNGDYATTLFTGNLRFLGSTLLHVIASATLGLAFAVSAKFRPPARTLAAAIGVILAIALHTTFNLLIINPGTSSALSAFFLVWTGAVIFFAAFEVLKYFQYRDFPNTNPQ